jgi:proteasome accessory factor B
VSKPDDVDLREIVARVVGDAPTGVTARVWIAAGRATALRRVGTHVEPMRLGEREGDVVSIDLGPLDRLARDIAGYGADAVALEPESLRDEVLARLRAQASSGVAGQSDAVVPS